MNKTLYIGTFTPSWRKTPISVYVTVKLHDGKLSITGVEGPKSNGDCIGGCGQIIMSIRNEVMTPADNWTQEMIAKLFGIWDRWHLNDMNAGDSVQMAYLRENPILNPQGDWYGKACAALDAAGLLVHDGYKFGTAWKREEVPQDIIDWLAALPEPLRIPPPAWLD